MAEPHICDARWLTSDPQEEWVKVVNGGLSSLTLTGKLLTDETETQQHPHIYVFPSYSDGTPITLDMFQRAYVVTGYGNAGWQEVDGVSSLVLYWDSASVCGTTPATSSICATRSARSLTTPPSDFRPDIPATNEAADPEKP
jgi:hypothetical protein